MQSPTASRVMRHDVAHHMTRVSLRASALFIEAIGESLQCGTVTGLGVTRRALIAAVSSARALHYVKEGLDWTGKDKEGKKSEDTFLQVLDKYTNLGIYLIHHTFTLAELFTMSGFYLTLNTLQTGFSAAEESVRMLDSILGSNESSRALSSIITLIRDELTREDPHFRPVGLLADQEEQNEEKQKKAGTLSSLTALTKALTAFACLQTATHRRTLRELKMRVVYDCTVVVEGQALAVATSTVSPSPHPQSSHNYDQHSPATAPPLHRPHLSQSHSHTHLAPEPDHLLTDVRSELEARAHAALVAKGKSAPSTPARSRQASVAFDLSALAGPAEMTSTSNDGMEEEEVELVAAELLDPRPEEEIVKELSALCGSPTRARSLAPHDPREGYEAGDEGETSETDEDEEDEGMMTAEEADGEVPPEVQAVLQQLEAQYAAAEARSSAKQQQAKSSPASTVSPSTSSTVRAPQPRKRGTHLVRADSNGYSYEIEIEETTTTMTTTVKTVEEVGGPSAKVVQKASRPRIFGLTDEEALRSREASVAEDQELEMSDTEGEWVEIASRMSPRGAAYPYAVTSGEDRDEWPTSQGGTDVEGNAPLSLAGLSRQDAIDHPEQSKQRLQLVLSTMTKKFTQRRRTVRRVMTGSSTTGSPSRSSSHSQSPAPGSRGLKRRWPRERSRQPSFTAASAGPSSESNTPTVASPTPSPKGKGRSVFRAFSRGFKGYKRSDFLTPPNSAADTPLDLSDVDAPIFDAMPTFTAPVQVSAPQTPDARRSRESSRQHVQPFPTMPSPHKLSSPSKTFLTLSPDPPSSPSKPRLRRTTSVQTMRSTLTTTCRTESMPTGEPEPKSGNFPHQHLVSNLQHFARYSSAAYGQSFLRILGIAKHEFKFPHTEIHANNHAFAHHVGIHVEDILLSSFTNPAPTFGTGKLSPIVNYVALDHSIKAVVLACRGSLGLSDILTDLTCSYEPISVHDGDPHASYFVHSGMYGSATVLQRGTVHDVIRDALKRFPDYGLVICGHSLGGGVASLLSLLWSSRSSTFAEHARSIEEHTGHSIAHPPISTPFVTSYTSGLPPGRPISCYTYGVPCVASPDLVAYCRGLVTSTIHNYDIVPTLSLGVLRDFKSMAMGFYAEQGVCEEIVGRVIGLCQKRFMARRAAKKEDTGSSYRPSSPPTGDDDCDVTPESLTDPSDESRLVPLTDAELTAGRGANKALEPTYRDPSLLGTDLVAGDSELSDWLWSLRTTIRAGSDSEKLYPPGNVYVVENYTVFISGESSATGKYSRREGRRVLLRAVDDVERRFSEPVFSRSMLSDHSPAAYENNCDLLAAAVV
ncbi:hypothetical protein AAT19DRAFT_11739 [Rhodotorula toruloides]|uniref:sn-1-specific diacylglycerol lipase n=1 Tax=Rhodotorula toruloides TaxID=5286 RepID=A0A2S9ZWE6_RHOTO|nr:hypothetical protein AAT19DRAFT_11739 [Rhodotorula toruloides]